LLTSLIESDLTKPCIYHPPRCPPHPFPSEAEWFLSFFVPRCRPRCFCICWLVASSFFLREFLPTVMMARNPPLTSKAEPLFTFSGFAEISSFRHGHRQFSYPNSSSQQIEVFPLPALAPAGKIFLTSSASTLSGSITPKHFCVLSTFFSEGLCMNITHELSIHVFAYWMSVISRLTAVSLLLCSRSFDLPFCVFFTPTFPPPADCSTLFSPMKSYYRLPLSLFSF